MEFVMKNRFEVSTEGMRMLHDGRPLWQLVKELVANCWDEEVSLCSVSINTAGKGIIEIKVEDDGNGFSDITDSYTLMKPTPKMGNANVRGRFNIGEKELLSIAREATIETVGYTVKFPIRGHRKQRRNDRVSGTVITATVKGRQDEIETTLDMLGNFIPPENVTYTLQSNFVQVNPLRQRSKVTSFNTTLKTVLSSGPNEPIRNTKRKTRVDVYKSESEHGGIYEMGIFIQPIEMPYDVNINQKVPLPPNRDVVSTAYLQDIYAEVLGRVKDEIKADDASTNWINMALSDERTTTATVEVMKDKQLGDNAVLWSSDELANEDAYLAGKDIVHSRTLSPVIRDKFKSVGLKTSQELFGANRKMRIPYGIPTKDMRKVERWTKYIAEKLLDIGCTVTFSNNPKANELATYSSDSNNLDFNVGRLGEEWFEQAPKEKQTKIIVHELGHANDGDRVHSGKYVDTLIRIGTEAIHKAPYIDLELPE